MSESVFLFVIQHVVNIPNIAEEDTLEFGAFLFQRGFEQMR